MNTKCFTGHRTKRLRQLLSIALLIMLLLTVSMVINPAANPSYASEGSSNNWTYTGELSEAHWKGTATLLQNGQVLVAGGIGLSGVTASAELYDSKTPNAGWINRKDLPIPIGYQGGDTIGEKIYEAGGNASTGPTDQLFSYDPVSDTWQTLASMPSARGYPGAIAEGGKLYVAGGETIANAKSGDLYAYTPGINTWDKLADMPALRVHGGMASWQGKLYFVGGMDENNIYKDTVYEYDINTNTWRLLTMLPEARFGVGAAVVDGILYVVGGMTPTEEASNIVWGYDLTLNSWSVKAYLPVAKWDLGYSTKSYHGKVYVVGGYTGTVMVRDVEVYDPLTDTWQMLPDLPKERTGIAAALINGELHAIGGYSFVYGTMGDHTALQVADGAFLSPPSQSGYAEAGETLTYTLQMVNLTGGTDSFDLELLPGSSWETTLSTDQVGPIADGEMVSFTASVEVPPDAMPGGSDSAVIQATSVTSPTVYTSTATLHTTAAGGPLAYVSYEGNSYLSMVDTAIHTTLDTIDLAQYGCSVIIRSELTHDRRFIYIPCYGSDQVLVLNTNDLSLEANIVQDGLSPWDTGFTQDGAYALVASQDGGIAVIDTATYTIVKMIPTTGHNSHIGVHPYLPRAYVANGDYAGDGNVLVIDTTDFTLLTSIHHGSAVVDVVVSPDGRYAYASEYTAMAGIAVIDTKTNAIITVIDGLGDTFDLQISPDGSRLYAAAGWSNTVHVIDAINFTYLTSVDVGGRGDIELNTDGSELYATTHTNAVQVIDTSNYTIIDTIQMPASETSQVAINPDYVAEGVHLTPAEQLLLGDRGDTLQFVETLSNYTGITDTFNLEMGDSLWPATLSDATLGPLGDGEQITFTVEVTIPLDADWGALNTVLVTATSEVSPTVYFDTAVLNSQRILPPDVYLPVALQNYQECPDFFDDFSDPDSGWFIGEDGTGQAEYLKGSGEYNVLVKPANYYWILKAPTCDQINYSVEVDARWSGNSGASYGLVFGVKGDFEQFYSFEVNSDYEQYALYRYGPDGWTEIVPFTYVYRTINPGVMVNHLKITRNGDTITLEVNGTVLGTWYDEAITGASGSGLIVSSYSDLGNAEARFDNYRVTGVGSVANALATEQACQPQQVLQFSGANALAALPTNNEAISLPTKVAK